VVIKYKQSNNSDRESIMQANQLTRHNILNASSVDSSHNIAVISDYKGLVNTKSIQFPIGACVYTLKIKIVLHIIIT